MAKEYIEREAAVMTAMDYGGSGNAQDASQDIASALMAIPSADVAPVVRGRWVISQPGGEWDCSKCGTGPYYAKDVHTLNFCPNCGADMREVK